MSTLIFDFDGTLADTFFIAVGVFRKLTRRIRSSRATDDEEIEILRGLSARQALKRVGARWWQLPYIVYEGRKAVRQQMSQVQAIKGVKGVVAQLHADGHRLLIVSTNSNRNISLFLQNNGMEQYFEQVYGGIGLFSKARTLTKITQERQIPLSECYYVGDEIRDVEAARRAGMPYVAVAWGYNNRHALKQAHANRIIDRPTELLKLVTK